MVAEVGAEVKTVKPGDHVVVATLANCGLCEWCNTGHPTWCRRSLGNLTHPFTYKGEPAANFAATSSFAELTVVSETQAVPISKDVPLTSACLIACGVLTGVGAVLNRLAGRCAGLSYRDRRVDPRPDHGRRRTRPPFHGRARGAPR